MTSYIKITKANLEQRFSHAVFGSFETAKTETGSLTLKTNQPFEVSILMSLETLTNWFRY